MIRTRIAPSPTGPCHLGTIRTAYFNYLAARSKGGKFIVRIDDTDKARSCKEYEHDFLTAMDWLGLEYDHLFRQSEVGYPPLAQLGSATLPDSWNDLCVGYVRISDKDKEAVNKPMFRSDGSPLYHFASVFDDDDMQITHVIRGVDHITNTSLHQCIGRAYGLRLPQFAHVGLLKLNGKKISKRDPNCPTVNDLRKAGFHPGAVLQFVARLGWAPKRDDRTAKWLTKDRMLELFWDEGNLRAKDSNVDMTKLASLDRMYKRA